MHSSSEWQLVEARWQMLRSSAAAYWSRLPANEVDTLRGDRDSLVRLVKRCYSLEQTGAEAQVAAWAAGIPTELPPPPARTKDEQRAEGEGMGVVPGAAAQPD